MLPQDSGKAVKKFGRAQKAVRAGIKKKRRRSRKNPFAIYAFKVYYPDNGISPGARFVMNSFVADIFKSVTAVSTRLAHYKGTKITSQLIKTALKLLFRGEFGEQAAYYIR